MEYVHMHHGKGGVVKGKNESEIEKEVKGERKKKKQVNGCSGNVGKVECHIRCC